jgi:RND superfamily putative drug exporter
MFRFLGQLVSRFWPVFLLAWVVLVAVTRWVAPAWNDVALDREFAFLPQDSPSRVAQDMIARAFPNEHLGSSIALVLVDPNSQDLERNKTFIAKVLEPRLREIAKAEGGMASEAPPPEEPLFSDEQPPPAPSPPAERSIIDRIRTPNAPGAGALLVSPDRQALLVDVELTTEFLAHRNWSTIDKISDLVQQLREEGAIPPGLDIALTGSAVIGRDHSLAELQSAHNTETLTIILVIVLLIAIYRAPLLALIPLITVYLAVQVSLGILSLLAQANVLTVFQGLQIYITILAYGAGVDYSLFLTARYGEELGYCKEPPKAVPAALGGVGAALAASAATVMCGIGMMGFAQFGKFREAGLAIPLSIFLVLCATLTFSPALLRLAGRWAFWPQALSHRCGRGRAQRRPFMGRFYRPGRVRLFWAKLGSLLRRRPGTVWFGTVLVMVPFVVLAGVLYNHLSYDWIGTLPADVPSVHGTRLLQQHFSAGLVGPVTVLLVNPHVDFAGAHGQDLVKDLMDRLRDQRETLGLSDIRSLAAPLGITQEAAQAFADLHLSPEASREVRERLAVEHYVTDLGERAKIGTRMDLILDQGPFSQSSIRGLARLQQILSEDLPADVRADTSIYVAGTTASVRDLATVVAGDRVRIEVLVLISVFVILVFLLRGLIVPTYLLASVLFSYYTTLGITFIVFWALDPAGFAGIDWKVVIFLLAILIAVGEDYNIFLMARVREEQPIHGRICGITDALTRTGPTITSCGIIMAGTFATLLAGSLNEMKQLGFALAFGVLLDTFIVRPILVPAFLILLNRGQLRAASRPQRRSATTLMEVECHESSARTRDVS